jgi:DNA-binding CsgD family transcriptional regulator
MPLALSIETANRLTLPACPEHSGSLVRRYRSHGANGPGVYPQCVPAGGEQPHLLEWPVAGGSSAHALSRPELSPTELAVLRDAAAGMTIAESAASHHKSSETVKSQRKAILIKLGARNMTQAVATAMRDQILGHVHHTHATTPHGSASGR